MKKGKTAMVKSLWKIAVIVLLLAALLVLAPSPLATSDAYAEVVDLPLEGKLSTVDWSRYLSDDDYEDPSLSVHVFRGNSFCVTRTDKKGNPQDCYTNYIYAVVKVASPTQIRSAFVGRAGDDYTVKGFRIAQENNAVFAVNGDYFCHPWHKETYIVRQGHNYKTRYVDKKWDILIIDQNGLSSSGVTREVMNNRDLGEKLTAFGWQAETIDGHDMPQILAALERARGWKEGPYAIVMNTVKGKGVSYMENNVAYHSSGIGGELYQKAIEDLERAGASYGI